MSMSTIKKLASQTVIYGLSSVLGRAISFLLLPLYTAVFTTEQYGIQSLIYVYAGVLFVFYVLRFDTAYFRFVADDKWSSKSFETAFSGVFTSASLLSAIVLLGAPLWATYLFNIGEEYIYLVRCIGIILFFDALAEIPYARLRHEHRAMRFASIRLLNIVMNVGLNCVFLLLLPAESIALFGDLGIGFIFLSNVIASITCFLLLWPQWKNFRWKYDGALMGSMWRYAWPLVLVGLAGIINELIDRALLDRLLPFDDATNKAQAGIYSAVYKFSILITLFTQAYRYAAEPFFFQHAKDKNSPKVYAQVAEYFVLAACIGFLCIMFGMPWLKLILRNPEYYEGIKVVPILIMANIFLGIYYNLSVWYKLTDKTRYAMYIALGGAAVTLILNVLLIPTWGYVGSAWATFICYGLMTLASYFIGRQYYDLQHRLGRMLLYMGISAVIYFGTMAFIG